MRMMFDVAVVLPVALAAIGGLIAIMNDDLAIRMAGVVLIAYSILWWWW